MAWTRDRAGRLSRPSPMGVGVPPQNVDALQTPHRETRRRARIIDDDFEEVQEIPDVGVNFERRRVGSTYNVSSARRNLSDRLESVLGDDDDYEDEYDGSEGWDGGTGTRDDPLVGDQSALEDELTRLTEDLRRNARGENIDGITKTSTITTVYKKKRPLSVRRQTRVRR